MKIEPVGVERDRQIAELRGDKCVHLSALPIEFGGCAPACHKSCISFPDACCREGDEYCLAYMDKPYSTDISAAMELLDDMRYEYAEIEITHIRNDEQWLIRPFKEDEDADCQNHEFEVREPTLQDAISGAWLRHKGGDNG